MNDNSNGWVATISLQLLGITVILGSILHCLIRIANAMEARP